MSIYDNETVFNSFLKEREDINPPFNLQVKPIMLKFLDDIKNKTILDLGCGLGHFSQELSCLGAQNIVGVDISKKEIAYAKEHNKSPNVEYKVLDAEKIENLNKKFDIITSAIVVDYIQNFNNLLRTINNCLNNNGLFIFSQVHPFSTAPKEKRKWLKDSTCESIYQLSDYSFEGPREMNYFDGKIKMYHRTFSSLLNSIINNNFELIEVVEPTPSKEELKLFPDRIKNLHKPSFLVFKLRKK